MERATRQWPYPIRQPSVSGPLAFLQASRSRLDDAFNKAVLHSSAGSAAASAARSADPCIDAASAAAGSANPSAKAGRENQAAASASSAGVARVTACSEHPAAADASLQADAVDQLVQYMVSQVGAGNMSVSQMSTLATKISAALPGRALPLAGMRERDLHRWCDRQPWHDYMPSLYEFRMPKYGRGVNCGQVRDSTHIAALPHEWFAALCRIPVLTEVLLTGGETNLRAWWDQAAAWGGPWFESLTAPTADPARRIPIGIHGDDAGGHGSEKVTVLTWGSVAIGGGTLDTRLVFSMLKESETPSGTGLDRLLQVLSWSLNAMQDGRYPSHDHDGRPFSLDYYPARAALAGKALSNGSFCGVWAEMRGDWKFLREALHLQQHYGSNDICHRCAATHHGLDHGLIYTNFCQTAALRQTLRNPVEWLSSALAESSPSPLLQLRNFCVTRVFFDIMHCLDLGVLQLAVPSALAELVGQGGSLPIEIFRAGDLAGRLAKATRHYRAWAAAHARPMRSVRFSKRWVQGPYPQITQLQAKAAELRSMQYWMRDVCSAVAEDHGSHGHIRAKLFESLVQVDETCRASQRFLTAEAAQKLAADMECALQMYNALAASAVKASRLLWKCIPKMHALTHVAYDNWGTNPRAVHCYPDEDMVGRMKKIYIKCHGATAPRRALQRYMLLVGVRWNQHIKRPRPHVKRLRPRLKPRRMSMHGRGLGRG